MNPPRLVRVSISQHARERMRERFPEGPKPARIVDEVLASFKASRVSAEKPPGVLNPTEPDCLYAWTEDGGRVYVLTVNRFTNGADFAVKTVIRAARPEREVA